MHHEVAEVEEDPSPFGAPLAAERLRPMLDQLVFDLARNRNDIALVASGGEQENVSEGKWTGDIERDEILGLFRVCGSRSDLE